MSRVFAISDLHVDILENLEWVKSLSETTYKQDVIIVAGDVTDDMTLLKYTLQNLKQKFSDVCYVPGNFVFISLYSTRACFFTLFFRFFSSFTSHFINGSEREGVRQGYFGV